MTQENKAAAPGMAVNPVFEIMLGGLLISRANTEELVGVTVLVGPMRGKLLLTDKSLRIVTHSGVSKEWLNYTPDLAICSRLLPPFADLIFGLFGATVRRVGR